jgi:hypothetical protein
MRADGLGARPPVPFSAPRAFARPARPTPRPARALLTLQDDLLERLPLQAVPAPQLLCNVALPAGEIGSAETRRHVDRCPGALVLRIRPEDESRRLQHEATNWREKASSSRTHLHAQATPRPPQTGFRLPPEMILVMAGRPASLPDVVRCRHTHGWCHLRALANDAMPKPEVSEQRGSRWEAF